MTHHDLTGECYACSVCGQRSPMDVRVETEDANERFVRAFRVRVTITCACGTVLLAASRVIQPE